MKRIVCITGAISQPRFVKRINSLVEAGLEVVVVGYDRGIYNNNKLPKGIQFINKGTQKDGGAYVSKFMSGYKDVTDLINKFSDERTLFYSFSFITAIWFYFHKAKYIYEISDILYGYQRMKMIQPLMKWFDKKIIKSSLLTIMTSEGFKRYFFGKKEISNVLIQPNKLSRNLKLHSERNAIVPNMDALNFSFVGSIRYFDTILRFAKIIGRKYPQHKFHFWGNSSMTPEFKRQCHEYDNVLFHGAFKNPDDLEEIYSKTDIVVACYENSNLNERIAEPNKMYESIFFCKPIIVSSNTFLSQQIERYQCGFAINAYDDNKIIDFIDNLDYNELVSISQRELRIDPDTLFDNPSKFVDRIV